LLAHILFIFGSGNLKTKIKNKSYSSITIFVIQVLEIPKSMSVQVFYLFGLILVYLQTSFCFLSLNSVNLFNLMGERTWPFFYMLYLIPSFSPYSERLWIHVFVFLVDLLQLSCRGGAPRRT
jgi:hypothetical protein